MASPFAAASAIASASSMSFFCDAPADTSETVNMLGLPLYARKIPDRHRDEWVRLEIESNLLPFCTRPQVLRSARRT